MVSCKKKKYRVFNLENEQLTFSTLSEKELYTELKAFIIIKSSSLTPSNGHLKFLPYFLDREIAIEIESYQDWWICEKLLKRKRIIFVVAGYPAIGMGHVYNSLTLAHEITNHEIIFLCTKQSELAVSQIAGKEYKTILQTSEKLEDDILALAPDIVVNDILNTSSDYILQLKRNNVRVINFEDEGSGAKEADAIINAIYEVYNSDERLPNHYWGHKYFCLRDEFLTAQPRSLSNSVKSILITFGGIDKNNYTLQTLSSILDICKRQNIHIYIVSGPGYQHKDSLIEYIEKHEGDLITFINGTNVISSIMEKVDIAISSAGRTIFELAHMRIPSIIISHHEREHRHTFAREINGFKYLGIMEEIDSTKMSSTFLELLDLNNRQSLYKKMSSLSLKNKQTVIDIILGD